MTRKDYIAVAGVLAAVREDMHEIGTGKVYLHTFVEGTLAAVVDGLADVMAADNPNFDRDRFAAACGVES